VSVAREQDGKRSEPDLLTFADEQAPYEALFFMDCDDVPITPYDPAVALAQMEAAYVTLLQRTPLVSRETERGQRFATGTALRSKVIVLGGDHTVVLPILRALHKTYEQPIAVLHFDAHLDTWKVYNSPGTPTPQSRINHGSFFARAADEGLVRAAYEAAPLSH
jgi:agmatinase